MPWGKKRFATMYDKEILAAFTGLEAIRHVVIDSTQVDVDPVSGRYVVEAGTVLVKGSTGKVEPAAASGVAAADVVGILTHTVEFFYPPEAEITDEPAAAFYHGCVFDINKLVNYSGNAANVKTALPTCRFDDVDVSTP